MNRTITARRPGTDEYGEYFHTYISKAPGGDIIAILREQQAGLPQFFRAVPAAKLAHRYAPEKWSVQEVLGHVIDAEWVFSYRALCFARGDQSELPGFDEQVFGKHSNCAQRPLDALLAEFEHLRAANIILFESFDETMLNRKGVAFGKSMSVRALLYIIAGHAQHHLEFIRKRYL